MAFKSPILKEANHKNRLILYKELQGNSQNKWPPILENLKFANIKGCQI